MDSQAASSTAVRLLLLAAALNVGIAAQTDDGGAESGAAGFLPLVSLFLLWRVSRGGHIAWVLSGSFAVLGAVVFVLSAASANGAANAPPLAVLYVALAAVLLTRPVRRLVGRAA